MTTVFILCAGSGDRWGDYLGVPKQLITFGGETLLERTVRLVIEHRFTRICCVARDSRISLQKHEMLTVSHSGSLIETILLTAEKWSTRNVFLLGDVFYSASAISRILACQQKLAFAGRPWPSSIVQCGHGELFGLTFASDALSFVRQLLNSVLGLTDAGVSMNLWNLYQIAGGLPLGSSAWLPKLLMPIDDYTNDIDTPIDFARRGWLYEKISSGPKEPLLKLRLLALFPKHYVGKLQWRLSQHYQSRAKRFAAHIT